MLTTIGTRRMSRSRRSASGTQALESVIRAIPRATSPPVEVPHYMRPSRRGQSRTAQAGPSRSGRATKATMEPGLKTYTIADRGSVTEVPAATIHYSLRQGLLPQPKRLATNRFVYDERHAQAL